MTNGAKAYEGLEQFSGLHKFLIRFYIAYLFLMPGISFFFHDQNYEEAPPWTRGTILIITLIYLGFVINNFHVPKNALRTAFLILRLPLELLIISLWQNWEPELILATLFAFEVIGFSVGLTIGTVFRNASIKMAQRIFCFVIAAGISICAVMRFSGAWEVMSDNGSLISSIALGVALITAIIPYAQMFIGGQDHAGLNTGTSNLTKNLGKYLALAMAVNITLMVLGLKL